MRAATPRPQEDRFTPAIFLRDACRSLVRRKITERNGVHDGDR
jgi:hypothetical protein